MVDGLAGASAIALGGLEAAQNKFATAAANIAQTSTAQIPNAQIPNAQTQTAAPPLTGGQIGTAGAQVGQALQGTGGDLATNLITVAAAKISYEANAKVLSTVKKLDRDTLDIVT